MNSITSNRRGCCAVDCVCGCTAVKDISNNELRDDTTDALLKVADELGKRASIVVDAIIQEMPIASDKQPRPSHRL